VAETADALETALAEDLRQLADRFRDDQLSGELYRALTNRRWRKDGGPEGAVSLSWSRAEELVNDLRDRSGAQPLELAQTGGEGDLSDLVRDELGAIGWRSKPLDTSRHDDSHVARDEGGEPRTPAGTGADWERQAHDEADAARRGLADAPPQSGPGTGAGGGANPSDRA
jgi:hypothetical protein